jgi:protein-S-isoprenylcysteine O-methyltransferase Ste14
VSPFTALSLLWFAWAVSWMAAAFWSDRAAKRPAMSSEILYRVVTIAGAFLLFVPDRYHVPDVRLWIVNAAFAWFLFAVAFAGFAFCWWARIHLGKLWSGWVTRKADHHIVDTGPYAIVRHPIYTGIILAALATAAVKGTIVGFAGLILMILGFWIKARLEERFLRQELGTETYDSYRRRVPMLLPFGPKAA